MSKRLASALVEQALEIADEEPAERTFLTIKGIDSDTAQAMADCWPRTDEELALRIVAPSGSSIAGRSLDRDETATSIRNDPRFRGGFCLVVCAGERVPDRQGIKRLDSIEPDALLGREREWLLLANVAPRPDGAIASEVGQALRDLDPASRPTPQMAAEFLDAVAADPSGSAQAMPLLGAFADHRPITRGRLIENLNLAGLLSDPVATGPQSLPRIREKARERFARTHSPADAERRVSAIAEALYGDPRGLLKLITFDEAAEILGEPPARDLADVVDEKLRLLRESIPEEDPEDLAGTIDALLPIAEDLREKETQKRAAEDLLAHVESEDEDLLPPDVIKKLRAVRRTRTMRAGPHLEEHLLKALTELSSPPALIEVRSPDLPVEVTADRDARAALSHACLRLRAGPILASLAGRGVEAPSLVNDLRDRLGVMTGMLEATRPKLALDVTLRVSGADRGDYVEVIWTPSVEDQICVLATERFRELESDRLTATAASSVDRLKWQEAGPAERPGDASPQADMGPAIARVAEVILTDGFAPKPLHDWVAAWEQYALRCGPDNPSRELLDAISTAGCIELPQAGGTLLTHLHPLKAEWLAWRTAAWIELFGLALDRPDRRRWILGAAREVALSSASQYPACLRHGKRNLPLLPSSDWSVLAFFGDGREVASSSAEPSADAISGVIDKLLDLHPEASSHLRIAALGDIACDAALRAVAKKLSLAKRPFERVELMCLKGHPAEESLRAAERLAREGASNRLSLRYFDRLPAPRPGDKAPQVHLGVVAGMQEEGGGLNLSFAEVDFASTNQEIDPLCGPKTWILAERSRDLILCPPSWTTAHDLFLRLGAARQSGWRPPGTPVPVPALGVDVTGLENELSALHDVAQWVATIDRYARRDTFQSLFGESIAILHQERRTDGAHSEGLIISQRSGTRADRAIAAALLSNHFEDDEVVANRLAMGLRASASRGHGVLALRAATTGSGINELIGHAAGFDELRSRISPHFAPSGSRLILISLDEYSHWFGRGKRADLLVLALPSDATREVWAAFAEVKTALSGTSQSQALSEAKTQITETLKDARFAIQPDGSIISRVWLNRIVEAAIGVARENSLRLADRELDALGTFRRAGTASRDWGGIGLVFGSEAVPYRGASVPIGRDKVPVALYGLRLDRDRLDTAVKTDPGDLRTDGASPALLPSSTKDRVRKGVIGPLANDEPEPGGANGIVQMAAPAAPAPTAPGTGPRDGADPPLLGIDADTGEQVHWRISGEGALDNGHIEIYGASGSGKTQFVKSLLAQLSGIGSRFSVCDFKDDYGADAYGTDFPVLVGAQHYSLSREPVPYNPMAGHSRTQREMRAFCIELRDMITIAAEQHVRMGPRQKGKLMHSLEEAFEYARANGRQDPRLEDVGAVLDDDLEGIIGDLFRFEFFSEGPPFGELINRDTIFSFKDVPGRGLTEDLLAGFILSSFYLRLADAPAVHSRVSFAVVVDEAHRVAGYKAIQAMVREQRSKGVAVILATQQPGDLPAEMATNAQTKVFLRLPARAAKQAGQMLDPDDKDLPEMIRSLERGQALVSIGGAAARRVDLRQFWRDDQDVLQPDQVPPPTSP